MSTPPPPHDPHNPPHTGPLPAGTVPAGQSPYHAPAYQQPTSSRPPQDPRDGFFRALFDLKFERFITLKFASVLYVICIVIAILNWLGTILSAFLAASAQSAFVSYASYYGGYDSGMGAGGVFMIIAAILLGWIPSLLMVVCARIGLEFIIASIRTAKNTQELVDSRGL
ncbi:DUF4282 domain-containing protein [Brevibacterium yomogidense]|uniref:DUF4282 domain-containing protein n=1 Tax=Brevibacterium yomogidense TaxID=946573 RepID=UPI0018DF5309|nr:DUF4282 domain-containing protein [Brevibacterium yomogidense]